jgi:O-methyltransferase
MLELAKRAHWLQTLIVRLITALPPPVEHNIEKTRAIKKAFYFTFLEQIEGDYLEFGVYEGTSLIAAFESDMKFRIADAPPRTFWGFDSFEGFKYFDAQDRHPFFKEGEFESSYEQTQQRIAKHFKGRADWKLVKGYFEDTLQNKTALDFEIDKISVALIDCDLGTPAQLTLNFMAPALQNGTILILDDYFAYGGSQKSGVAGAFQQFQHQHPHLVFRRILDYGHGGQGFVVADGA